MNNPLPSFLTETHEHQWYSEKISSGENKQRNANQNVSDAITGCWNQRANWQTFDISDRMKDVSDSRETNMVMMVGGYFKSSSLFRFSRAVKFDDFLDVTYS